ncbi:MAG: IclR family transcriptional regulator [Chloroflexota bacterium]|nr:IclR family transcriptional regulator [Chloroflexota bacterium]
MGRSARAILAGQAAASDGIRSVRAVERALDLLNVLEASGRPMRLTEVARVAEMHKATTQRLLNVLERRAFVQKVRGVYQVGVASLPLAHAFVMGNSLTRAAQSILQELGSASGETVSVFVRLGFSRVAVQRIEANAAPRYSLPLGQRLPLHLGAGRVLAAAMDTAELAQLLAELGEIRLATGEVLDRATLLAELERIRRQGFYVASSERSLGLASVSAPVVEADGRTLAVVCVTVPTERLTEDRTRELIIAVRHAADAIAASIAYS